MHDDKLEISVGRGARAEELLRNELLLEAFAALEAEYIDFWKRTQARDAEAREKLFLAVQVVGKVRQHLSSVAMNAKLAQKELEDLASTRRLRFGII